MDWDWDWDWEGRDDDTCPRGLEFVLGPDDELEVRPLTVDDADEEEEEEGVIDAVDWPIGIGGAINDGRWSCVLMG